MRQHLATGRQRHRFATRHTGGVPRHRFDPSAPQVELTLDAPRRSVWDDEDTPQNIPVSEAEASLQSSLDVPDEPTVMPQPTAPTFITEPEPVLTVMPQPTAPTLFTEAEQVVEPEPESEPDVAREPEPEAPSGIAEPRSLFDDIIAGPELEAIPETTPAPDPQPEPAVVPDEALVRQYVEPIVTGEAAEDTDHRVVEVHVVHQWEDSAPVVELAPPPVVHAPDVYTPAPAIELPDFEEREPDEDDTASGDEPVMSTSLFDDAVFGTTEPAALPEPPKVKEPLFVWRGKPIGSDKPAPARGKKKQQKQTTDTGQIRELKDPHTWLTIIMDRALDLGASDLQLILVDDVLTARVRIDGQMREFASISGDDAKTVIGRFRTAAELSSGGFYVPEEKIYEVDVDNEKRKVRVNMFRTTTGIALELRLPPTGPLRSLDELQFAPANLALFRRLLGVGRGLVLIAGPMGSGKTTTAHAALKELTTPNRNVWSVEDPVERILPGVTQLEVDEANGAGFEALLPALVRSDYDTLFLGEIRDRATAAAGVRQAKVGRQVVTTIHATDNVVALLRLIELAEDSPLSVMEAVKGVVSQRLVRRLNPEWDHKNPLTKYRGRIPIHESLVVNDSVVEALMENKSLSEIKRVAAASSPGTFKSDGERLVTEGVTDWEEVSAVLGNE